MKNKYGFTLIELLAVIVVLAIIALIATPIVMNTIKNAKKGSAERGADNYIKQVETAIATSKLDNKEVLDGEYPITSDGNLCRDKSISCSDSDKITIEMNGEKPKSGRVVITDGQVTTRTLMIIGDYGVSYDNNSKKYIAEELYKGILCKAVTTATTGNVPQGNFNYGDEYTCELGDGEQNIFFVLETSGDNVSLIMNKNLIPAVSWCSDASCQIDGVLNNAKGPLVANKALKTNVKNWTKMTVAQIMLPTANQIAIASGKTFNDSNVYNLSTWLSDYLYESTQNPVSDAYGYWTSTPSSSSSIHVWSVYAPGRIITGNIGGGHGHRGVRPVITISKSNLE